MTLLTFCPKQANKKYKYISYSDMSVSLYSNKRTGADDNNKINNIINYQ